jgi:hypothetical protein
MLILGMEQRLEVKRREVTKDGGTGRERREEV